MPLGSSCSAAIWQAAIRAVYEVMKARPATCQDPEQNKSASYDQKSGDNKVSAIIGAAYIMGLMAAYYL